MEILTAEQMTNADKTAVSRGIDEKTLMKNAGFAAACIISRRFKKCPVFVMCGTGNNGGDGVVIARTLLSWGYPVTLASYGEREKFSPSRTFYTDRYDGNCVPLSADTVTKALNDRALFIDAVFGIGLNRAPADDLTAIFRLLNDTKADIVGIDIPSGVDADTGRVFDTAPACCATVTFCRPKPAHFLYPAKRYVGELYVADIGITDEDVALQHPFMETNDAPETPLFPDAEAHKYTRGAVLVKGGDVMTGAASLATRAALHAGAGWVGICCSSDAKTVYSRVTEAVLYTGAFATILADRKIKAVALGMGLGVSPATDDAVRIAVESRKPVVLDADALRYIRNRPLENAVLTPHDGEFNRTFPALKRETSKIQKALKAAQQTGAVVVLKGADTVIAAPDGRVAVNTETTPFLATAGSGDVLAGMIAATLATGLPPFEAAKTAVYRHAHAKIDATTPFTASELANDV